MQAFATSPSAAPTRSSFTERALTDHLTGLPNRTLLADRLATAIAAIGRRDLGVAVLFIDVDRFKVVNDSPRPPHGRPAPRGPRRPPPSVAAARDTVACLGGDEFVVLCQDLAHRAEAVEVAERIFALLEAPFPLARARTGST